jgi:hypothetical protein
MRVKISRDGESVTLDSTNWRIVATAKVVFVGMLVVFLLDITHPLANLECVRHEARPFPRVGESIVDLKSSQGEDNDCELFVRRHFDTTHQPQLAGGDSSNQGQGFGAIRAACFRFLRVSEVLFSFEIETVLAVSTNFPLPVAPPTHYSVDEQRRHHNHHLHPRSKAPGVRIMLRDPWGPKFTVYDFSADELQAAGAVRADIEGYLAQAADVAASPAPVHLSVCYDTSHWEEAVGWVLLAVFLTLAWAPSREVVCFARSIHGSRFGTVELRRSNLLRWTRLQLAVTLDAVSHISVVEELSYTLRMTSGSPQSALAERREYGLRLYFRSAAVPVSTLRRLVEATRLGFWRSFGKSEASSEAIANTSSVLEFPLGFGIQQCDPALLRRAAEAVSALQLDQKALASQNTGLDDTLPNGGNRRSTGSSNSSRGLSTSLWAESSRTGIPTGVGSSRDDLFSEVDSKLEDSGRCVVCLQTRAQVAFFPCKHMRVCQVCSGDCEVCPICRSLIQERHVLFI